jgi:hypothetical protein
MDFSFCAHGSGLHRKLYQGTPTFVLRMCGFLKDPVQVGLHPCT